MNRHKSEQIEVLKQSNKNLLAIADSRQSLETLVRKHFYGPGAIVRPDVLVADLAKWCEENP